MKYFSYDPTEYGWGFELHNTAEEAKRRANEILLDQVAHIDEIDDAEISETCWGEVKERAIKHILTDGEEQLISYCIQDPNKEAGAKK